MYRPPFLDILRQLPHAWKARACSCAPRQFGTLAGTASVSQHAPSWEDESSTGRIDKTPVLTQNLPDEQRFYLDAVLPWPWEVVYLHSSGTQLAAWAGNPRAVSPCGTSPVRRLWPVAQQGALAQGKYSTHGQKRARGDICSGCGSTFCMKDRERTEM